MKAVFVCALLTGLFSITAVATPVEGTYVRTCYIEGEDVLESQIQIKNDLWLRIFTGYEEPACQSAWIQYQESYRVSLSPTENHSLLNLEVQNVWYTVLTDEVAEVLNSVAYCGIQNWKSQERREVTGLECDEYQVPAAGSKIYARAQISEKSILFSQKDETHDGLSEKTRHKNWEPHPHSLF